jgi:hypothetical protein
MQDRSLVGLAVSVARKGGENLRVDRSVAPRVTSSRSSSSPTLCAVKTKTQDDRQSIGELKAIVSGLSAWKIRAVMST